MSSSFSSTKKRKDVWRNNERHYCEVCNTWMGSDRQSILIHENGKKHQENVELALKKKRSEKQQQEQQQSFLESSLQQMERAAAAAAAVTGGAGGVSGTVGRGGGLGHSVAPGGRMNMLYRQQQHPPPSAMGRYYPQVPPAGAAPPHHQQYYHGQPPPPGPPPPHQQYHPAAAIPPPPPPPPPPRSSQQPKSTSSSLSEVNDWHAKKHKREQEELEKKRKRRDGEDGDDEDDDDAVVVTKDPKRRRILPGEGYYSYHDDENGGDGDQKSSTNTTMTKIKIGTTTDMSSETRTKEEEEDVPSKAEEETSKVIYLEGKVYYGLLQDDLPVELWTGSNQATDQELKSASNRYLWKPALVIQVQQKGSGTDNDAKEAESSFSMWTAHVSYLATPNDEDETILKRVPARLLRIQLGHGDEKIPDTLEEARLLAMGGEEVVVVKTNENQKVAASATKSEASDGADAGDVDVDEATGLSGWSTVSVHRTTVKQQAREERERHAEKRRLAKIEKEVEAKRMEERRMEEAKVGNADDSALGAYDVFGRGGGYKGVDISDGVGPGAGATASGEDGGGPLLSVDDTAKRLASANGDNDGNGGPVKVSFRKFNKKKKKGGARRTTSADDDD
mmetsp:Transcript_7728/g.19157  ORF Transcript_7728/g.19157 Transcript_7728/m.19157 type:complete len:619 (-) Transcript_7728:2168-4024(-)